MGQSVKSIRKALTKASSVPVELSSAMPSGYYVSEEFRILEEEHVFRKEWVCLGRAAEIAEPGSYYTTTVINEPLLVTKDRNHEITVLSNVCRHRGNIIASGSGKLSRFTCGYHAWTYDLRGRLIGAPFMNEVKGFDPTVCSLPRFKTEIWQGFLFVNLSGKAKPLAPRLEQLMPYLENYEIDKRPHAFTKEATWATNWKCLAENFMEGYHLDVTHPTTLRPLTPTSRCEYVPSNGNFNAYYSYYEAGDTGTEVQTEGIRMAEAAPGPITDLTMATVSERSVTLKWQIPIYTGGGIVTKDQNCRQLRSTGVVIWLDIDSKIALKRLSLEKNKHKRPLVQNNSEEDLMKLFEFLYLFLIILINLSIMISVFRCIGIRT